MYVHASPSKGTGSAWVNPDWNGVKEKLWEKSLLFCSMSLKGGLDSEAEPESGDRQEIQDIYSKGLLLILPYPTPSLGSMYTARIRKWNRWNELLGTLVCLMKELCSARWYFPLLSKEKELEIWRYPEDGKELLIVLRERASEKKKQLLLFSRPVVSDSLWPCGLQHTDHCLVAKGLATSLWNEAMSQAM